MAARLTRATFGENGSGRRTIYLKFVGPAEHVIVSEEEVSDEG